MEKEDHMPSDIKALETLWTDAIAECAKLRADNEALEAENERLRAAALQLLEQAEACWQHHYGHMSEDEMATVPQHIAEGRAAYELTERKVTP